MTPIKKLLFVSAVFLGSVCRSTAQAPGMPDISGIITSGVTRVIRAFDLQIQRFQTQTIWLQNVQKKIETAMQQLHLDEIGDWVQKTKNLYSEYFDELWRVKTIISYYHRIKDIVNKQLQLVAAYKRAYQILRQDTHFSQTEISYMGRVYEGILNESLKNLDELYLAISSFRTQMADSKRLEIIDHAGDQIDKNYADLMQFNNQSFLLSLRRSQGDKDAETIRRLYGLQ